MALCVAGVASLASGSSTNAGEYHVYSCRTPAGEVAPVDGWSGSAGKVVQSTVADENGGRCRDVGQSTDGLPAFLYLQPCPASESVDVPFNTTAVGNGEHHLIVSVLEAAGNSAPVLDREIDVDNPVPAAAAQPSVRVAGPGVARGLL